MVNWKSYLKKNQNRFTDELIEFLSIPTISSNHKYDKDFYKAACWLVKRLKKAGISNAKVIDGYGQPYVYGEYFTSLDAKTLLIYGHYDVQPVDENKWISHPFKPEIRDNKIFARGSSDDKGNLLIPVFAAEAIIKTYENLNLNLKFLFDGEEEIGSPNITKFIGDYKETLSCDVAYCADGAQLFEDAPSIVLGTRGICEMEVTVTGSASDLHSGRYGGAVHNSVEVLSSLISSMKDENGTIVVDGFYDGIIEVSDLERGYIEEVPFNILEFMNQAKIKGLISEPGYSYLEQLWIRPSLDIVGLWGGFIDKGMKTIIPCESNAKIACRLVPGQNPLDVFRCIEKHLIERCPDGVEIKIFSDKDHGSAEAYFMPIDHWGNNTLCDVFKYIYKKEPYYIRWGATIPICAILYDMLGIHSSILSFGMLDENIHAPNEFFRLDSFIKGQHIYCSLFETISKLNNKIHKNNFILNSEVEC
ncbi:MAG TPA: dipeptidase [Victivallales bacterium]|nr:dipeptidase [Victivallales bacterium]